MAAFMNKKDAQNLPFFSLDNSEIQKLGFNSLLMIKDKCHSNYQNVVTKLENTVRGQTACISFLRTENTDLKRSAEVQDKKCLHLGREIDRVTETYKGLLESQKRKNAELDKTSKEELEHAKSVISEYETRYDNLRAHWKRTLREFVEQDAQVRALKLQLEQQTALSSSSQQQQGAIVVSDYHRNMINRAKEELQDLSTICSQEVYGPCRDKFYCEFCGSKSYHPEMGCNADLDEETSVCGCCNEIGHHTLLCDDLDKFF